MKKKILSIAVMFIATFTFVAGMDTTAYSKVGARFGGGMYDEADDEEKPVYKVENKETKKIKKVTKKKTKKNKKKEQKSTKKDKNKIKNKVSFITDEEEAAYHGYTLEEWEALPDEEKYGTIEGSKGEVKPSGESLGFDWD